MMDSVPDTLSGTPRFPFLTPAHAAAVVSGPLGC